MSIRLLNIGTFVCATALTLLFSEFLLRGYFSVVQHYDIEMWRYARLLKEPVGDARSHVHVPNAKANIMGVRVNINSKGLRDEEYGYDKPPGTTRILVIGDSLTFGFGVSTEDTFADIIERKLNKTGPGKYEVINAGIGNYNTEQEMAFLTAEGFRYHPDIVVLGWYINDAEPTQKYPETFLARHSTAYMFLKSTYNTLQAWLNPGYGYAGYYRLLYVPERWPAYQEKLVAFEQSARNSGAKLVVVLLPELHSLDPYPFTDIHKRVAAVFDRDDIQVIDATQAFQGVRPSETWVARDDAHPNNRAHARIADYVLTYINFNP